MYLSGFLLQNQYLFLGQDSTEFFYALFCPFDYGIHPYTFPAAMAIASLAYEKTARNNDSQWHLRMSCLSSWLIAYILMTGIAFLLSRVVQLLTMNTEVLPLASQPKDWLFNMREYLILLKQESLLPLVLCSGEK